MRTTSEPQGKAMYVASQLDESWLLNVQKGLYTRSMENPDYVFGKLWGLLTDPRNLRIAVERVARNKGRRTAGVDGLTVRQVLDRGVEPFVATLRAELRSGAYRPSPVRRVLIPKTGQPGKYRPLGIPTVRDRVVQAAVKNILEPIFEADFYPTSYGFRPGKSVHGTLEHLRLLLTPAPVRSEVEPGLPYQWAIEGDIKGCFDNIDHHGLMKRVRRRIGDAKVNRLIVAFLKAGVLSEEQFFRGESGTPQGGILSPLLANIALSVIDERYERHVWPHRTPTLQTDPAKIATRAAHARQDARKKGEAVLFPIRYADDFIILVGVPPGPDQMDRAKEVALQEKAELATLLKEQLGLELSETKTLVTSVTEGLRFVGHTVGVRPHKTSRRLFGAVVIPKERSQRLRERVKALFRRRTIGSSLAERLRLLNPMVRGWANFYRYANDSYRVFHRNDRYVWWTITRWLKKKHGGASIKRLGAKYGLKKQGRRSIQWRDGLFVRFEMASVRTGRFKLGWQHPPAFAQHIYGEPSA